MRLFGLPPITASPPRRRLISLLLWHALLATLGALLPGLLASLMTALLALLLAVTRLLIRPLAIPLLARLLLLLLRILLSVVRLPVVLLAAVALRLVLTLLLGRIGLRPGGRRSVGVDLERPPFGPRDVRCLRTVIHGHGPILEHAPRAGALLGRHDRRVDLQHARMLAAKHLGLRPAIAPLEPRLDRYPRECIIGVERPHPHGDRRVGGHLQHLLPRLLDRHLGGQVGRHFDAMLELLEHRILTLARPGTTGHEPEPIGAGRRPRAIGVEPQRKAPRRPRQIVLADPQRHVLLAVAAEVDPGGVERSVALRDDRHAGAFHAPQITLPGDRLRRPPRVAGVLVFHLAHEQRRRVDHGDPQPIAGCVPCGDHELEAVIEAPRRIGQDRHLPPLGIGRHRHPPGRRRRVEGTIVAHPTDHDFRPLSAVESADATRHHQLAAPHHRDGAADRGERMRLPAGVRRRAGMPPGELRRIDPHPRRWPDGGPGRDEPRRRHEQALRRRELVDAGRGHEPRQGDRELERQAAIHHPLGGHG